jgi:hypothetical protein
MPGVGYRKSGVLFIDQYEPGHCGWRLTAIGFHSFAPSSEGAVIASYDGMSDSPQKFRLDIWCAKDVKQNAKRPEFCYSLNFLSSFPGLVSKEFLSSVPMNQRDNGGPVHAGPNTRSIVIDFHDLDAMPGSLSAPRH